MKTRPAALLLLALAGCGDPVRSLRAEDVAAVEYGGVSTELAEISQRAPWIEDPVRWTDRPTIERLTKAFREVPETDSNIGGIYVKFILKNGKTVFVTSDPSHTEYGPEARRVLFAALAEKAARPPKTPAP